VAETIFKFDENNYLECQNAYRGAGNSEYYSGEASIEPGPSVNVRGERKSVGSCSIIRMRSKNRLFFRRSLPHIRQDATDVTVLWFVKSGRLCVSHQNGHTVAEENDFVITKSMTPFAITCEVDDRSIHEVLHVVIPTHTLRRFVSQNVGTGFSAPAKGRALAIVEHLISHIFEDDNELTEDVAQVLIESALSVLGRTIVNDLDHLVPVRQTMSDRRLQEVLRFIDVHLSDPKLNLALVAAGCGISPRYISLLLQLRGVSFTALVWERRLDLARTWLLSTKTGMVSISEVAFSVGFKSTAHFSRMFKQRFGMSPKAYRLSDCGNSRESLH
jgi:AraC family transcriptional regulator, positive regulator of tynA and feaB